jgi:hypothetical protein
MAAHSNFGGLFPNAGILLTAQSNQRAVAYCAAAEQDERAGFLLTAAFEWRRAAECFSWDTDEANRCWCNWERLMGLPRLLARAFGDDPAADLLSDRFFAPTVLAA